MGEMRRQTWVQLFMHQHLLHNRLLLELTMKMINQQKSKSIFLLLILRLPHLLLSQIVRLSTFIIHDLRNISISLTSTILQPVLKHSSIHKLRPHQLILTGELPLLNFPKQQSMLHLSSHRLSFPPINNNLIHNKSLLPSVQASHFITLLSRHCQQITLYHQTLKTPIFFNNLVSRAMEWYTITIQHFITFNLNQEPHLNNNHNLNRNNNNLPTTNPTLPHLHIITLHLRFPSQILNVRLQWECTSQHINRGLKISHLFISLHIHSICCACVVRYVFWYFMGFCVVIR